MRIHVGLLLLLAATASPAVARDCPVSAADVFVAGYWDYDYGEWDITGYFLRGLDADGAIVWEVDLGLERIEAAHLNPLTGLVYALHSAGEVWRFHCDGVFLGKTDLDLQGTGFTPTSAVTGYFDGAAGTATAFATVEDPVIRVARWDIPFSLWDPGAPPAGDAAPRIRWTTRLDGIEGPGEDGTVMDVGLSEALDPWLDTAERNYRYCGDPRRCAYWIRWEEFEFDRDTGRIKSPEFQGSLAVTADSMGVRGIDGEGIEFFARRFAQPVVMAERGLSHRGWAGLVLLRESGSTLPPRLLRFDELGDVTDSLPFPESSAIVQFQRTTPFWAAGAVGYRPTLMDSFLVVSSQDSNSTYFSDFSVTASEIGSFGETGGVAMTDPLPWGVVPIREVGPSGGLLSVRYWSSNNGEGTYYYQDISTTNFWYGPTDSFIPGALRWVVQLADQPAMELRYESGVHIRIDLLPYTNLSFGSLIYGYELRALSLPTHDIDADHDVDEADVAIVRHHLLGDQPITDERGLAAADVDYDGTIAIDDAVAIGIVAGGGDPDPAASRPEPGWSYLSAEDVGEEYLVVLSLELGAEPHFGVNLQFEPIDSGAPVLGIEAPEFEPSKTSTSAAEVGRIVSTGAGSSEIRVRLGADPDTGLTPDALRATGSCSGPNGELVVLDAVEFPLDQFVRVGSGPSSPSPVLSTALHPVSPNPFNPRTTVRFDLAEAGPVRLGIYDTRGRRVVTLVGGPLAAGEYAQEWDGHDARGRAVSSGVYWARLEADGRAISRKLVLVR